MSEVIKWFPVNKGGDYRLYYGNNDYVINLYKNGKNIKESSYNHRLRDKNYYFKNGVTWSRISSQYFAFRYQPKNQLFGDAGPLIVGADSTVLGFLNSKVSKFILGLINPTINIQGIDVERLPIIETGNFEIEQLVDEIIGEAKSDWDSFEVSWGFETHPFMKSKSHGFVSNAYKQWESETINRFSKIKENGEEINKRFIALYNLNHLLYPDVNDGDVTINLADRKRDTKSFLSYFIGCVMGRYSLDVEGLVYAGGEFDESKHETFKPNKNGLIQLTDDHYFDNDIIFRLREFLSVAFSPDTVDENMQWLAESLTIKKNESPEERLRRYFLDEFFKDHCKTYQKRPIYWLVDSGKQKGLRTLIYMHRYKPDTMATIRFEHLQEIQSKYQNEISMIDTRLANPSLSATDRRSLEKAKTDYQKKLDELQEFDKHLATYANEQIAIDLDDGVKVNYAKFDKILAKIK